MWGHLNLLALAFILLSVETVKGQACLHKILLFSLSLLKGDKNGVIKDNYNISNEVLTNKYPN
jgi:hypothetical protein